MNGDELAVKEITVIFGEKYGVLPIPNRSGCTFFGWFSRQDIPVVSGTIVETPRGHTLYAEWTETTSEKVEVVFMRIT